MYLKDPSKIEDRSMELIEAEMTPHTLSADELAVVKRTIHTAGDLDYQNIVSITPGAIEAGKQALQNGGSIVTDTKMAYSGINKRNLEKLNVRIDNYITHETVMQMAKEQEITRSMAAMEFACQQGVDIFVIGNAPTALFKIGELIQAKKAAPKLVIGVPVGFVGAAESKEYIREFEVPSITTVGRKGGSAIAAAIVNALLLLSLPKE